MWSHARREGRELVTTQSCTVKWGAEESLQRGTSGVKARGDRLHPGDLWSLPSCALTPPESVLRAPKCPGQTAAWLAGLPAGFRRAKWLTGNSSCCSVKRTVPASYGILDFLVAGEGIGNPLQYSCLENPMDGGAW